MFRRLLFFVLYSIFLFWPVVQAAGDYSPWQAAVRAIERSHKVAIGLSLRDASGKVLLEWRSRERFPLTSTVKALQCARVYDLGLEQIHAPIGSVAVVAHSPVYADSSPDTVVSLTRRLVSKRQSCCKFHLPAHRRARSLDPLAASMR